MKFEDYFQKELIALRDLGTEAASRNPALAPFFDTPGRDPDIERLLESFAFLRGRLRQKLDDELPEITHGLFSRLWPNYLRPLPAASIIQFQPTDNVTGCTVVPKGTLVHSAPVEGTPCTFQTAYDTEVLPLRIAEQRFIESNGTVMLAVRFALTSGELSTLPLTHLRLFFSGKEQTTHSLYFTLIQNVREIRFILRDAQMEERCTAILEPSAIRAVGFDEQEGMYPYPETTASGYRILQEYFCFPEKFLFVEINGLKRGLRGRMPEDFQPVKEFELHFVLRELPKERESFHKDNWNLFCTPVVNLFPLQATPLEVKDPRQEFKVVPNKKLPDHFAVYSVDRVSSWGDIGKGTIQYENFYSFDIPFSDSLAATYRQDVRPALNAEEVETYITLNSDSAEPVTVELALTCTNRMLPKNLGIGDICVSAESENASALSFVNILPVVSPFPPPLQGDLLWKLLSTMSLNYIALTDVKSLRAILSTYNFRANHDHRCALTMERTLQGITAIKSMETDRIFKGLPMRGVKTHITLDEACFSCEGSMYLFGTVLNEFLAMYATVNSFQQLTITGSQGKEYFWPARLGNALQWH